jgi:hypothetical protein
MRCEIRSIQIVVANEDDIRGYKFYNYPLVAEYQHERVILSSGRGDKLSLLREEDQTLVLSTNYNLGYAGLEVIDWKTGNIIANVFFQSVNDYLMGLGDYLKKDFFDYTEINQAKILLEYAEGSNI